MSIPASLVLLALLAVGGQLFSATVSAVLRTRRGRDIATFLILGLAAGSFCLSRREPHVANKESGRGGDLDSDHRLVGPASTRCAQKAIFDVSSGQVGSGVLALAAASAGLIILAVTWRRLLGWLMSTPVQQSKPAAWLAGGA